MKPPLLQTDWMNRVAFVPGRSRDHVESFSFKLNDPDHPRALSIQISLWGHGGDAHGDVRAIWFDEGHGTPLGASERFMLSRVSIDPERAGLCIAEASAEEGFTQGVARGKGFSITWKIWLDDEVGPYIHLPRAGMYESSLVPYKMVSPHPCAKARGWVEIWRGTGPGSPVERISVDGWRSMQGHTWGSKTLESHAWAHCNAFDDGRTESFFEAFAGQTRAIGMSVRPVAGRLVHGGRTYRFDTWRNIWNGGASEVKPTRWTFAMSGPDGSLQGEVEGDPEQTIGTVQDGPDGRQSHRLRTDLARMTLRVQGLNGTEMTLSSQKAALEVVQHDTKHGIRLMSEGKAT